MKKHSQLQKWYWWNWSGANFQKFHMQGAPAKSCAKRFKVWKWTNVRWNSPETWHPPTCRIVNNDLPDALTMKDAVGIWSSLSESQGTRRDKIVSKRLQVETLPFKTKSKTWSFHLPQNLLRNPGHVNLYLPPRSGATVEICIFPQLSCRLKFHVHNGWIVAYL